MPCVSSLFCFSASPHFRLHGAQANIITSIRVIGNRRIPKDTILARLFSHENEPYDPATVERDFNSLWNTGYFANLRIEKEDTPKGVVLDIYVTEKPTISEINYKGLSSITQSDILDAYKKAKVEMSPESQFDQTPRGAGHYGHPRAGSRAWPPVCHGPAKM